MTLYIGPYAISPHLDGKYYIEHEDGRGMQVSKEALLKIIKDFFEENID